MKSTESPNKDSGFFKYDQVSGSQSEVTHSSALFLVVESETKKIKTEICFLNYWRIKRDVAELGGRITIRGLDGGLIYEDRFDVLAIKAYTIKLSPILRSLDLREFKGTIELEFFSKVNLFIPYPAAVVRYVGRDWHTGMHSTARYFYQDSGDSHEMINRRQAAAESNITLFSELDITNTVFLHNGIDESLCQDIALSVTNQLGGKLQTVLSNIKMCSRETIGISVDDHIDYKAFLQGKRGMLTVEYMTTGVFPRVMFLNETSDGEFSVEHSNFGQSIEADSDCLLTAQPNRNLLFSLPVLPEGYTTEIDIYPTFPILKSPYSLRVTCEDFAGVELSTEEITLDREYPFHQHKCDSHGEAYNIQIDYMNPEKLPNRFHTAVNYRHQHSLLPGITLDGPSPRTGRSNSTRWSPFYWDRGDSNTRIFICARVFDPDTEDVEIAIHCQFFGEHESEKLSLEKKITQRQSLELNIGEILSNTDWTSNAGWVYMTFNPSAKFCVYYLSEMAGGSIMCDHAF